MNERIAGLGNKACNMIYDALNEKRRTFIFTKPEIEIQQLNNLFFSALVIVRIRTTRKNGNIQDNLVATA